MPNRLDGQQRYVFSLADVTAREAARRALDYNEELLRTFVDLAPVGIALTDFESGRYLSVNRTFEELLGYSKEEFLELTHWDVTTAECLDGDRKQKEIAAQTGSFGPFEKTYQSREGSLVEALLNGRLVTDTEGRRLLWSIVVDIGTRKARELELAEHKQRLEGILWGTGVGTWEWNFQTSEIRFNERWAEMLGYTLEELGPITTATWPSLTHPEDLQRSAKALERHFRGDDAFYECEIRMRHQEGDWIWILDRGRIISRTEGGDPLWVAGIHLDISDAKKVREELAQRLEHARRYESLALMAGSMAHQFNNLLTVVLNSLEFAAEEIEGADPLGEFVGQAMEAAWRASSLVQQMLLYSGRNQFAFEAFDLGVLLTEKRDALRLLISAGNELRFELTTASLPLLGAQEQLLYIIGQLLRNAEEAAFEEGTEIAVLLRRAALREQERKELLNSQALEGEQFAILEVRDAGSGMSQAVRKRAFDPFFSTRERGRGLGLSAVLGIVRSHRAAVGLDSEVGQGTTVKLVFPLKGA